MKCSELSDFEFSKIRDVITNKYVLLKNNFIKGMIPLKDLRIAKSDSFITVTDKLGYCKEYNKLYELVYSGSILIVYSYDSTIVDIYHMLIDLNKFKDYYVKNIQSRIIVNLFSDTSNYEMLENYIPMEQLVNEYLKAIKALTEFGEPIKLKINKTEIKLTVSFDNLSDYLFHISNEINCNFVLSIDRLGINLSAQSLNYLFKSLDSIFIEKGVHKW